MTSALVSLLGAASPRVEHRPTTAVDTLGPIAAELGEQAGVILEPWQRSGLDMLLSIRDDGKWACYEYAELCSRRNGKTAMLLVRALFGFLYGHVLTELQEIVERPEETDHVLRLGLHRLPIGEFPHLRDLAPTWATYDGLSELDRGLDILLSGLATRLAIPNSAPAHTPESP